MPVSGLVLTLNPDAADAAGTHESTLESLRALAALELGELMAGRLAAVLEADDYAAHDARLDALRSLPGVAWVDVVFHDFSDLREFERPPRRRDRGDDARAHTDDGGTHGPA